MLLFFCFWRYQLLSDIEHLNNVKAHILHVQSSAEKIAGRLIKNGEERLARELVAVSLIHDNSKFFGIEWEYLRPECFVHHPELARLAHQNHVTNNPHHPEYWGSIQEMPRLYLAEFVCDIHARSSEFGSDLWAWVKNTAIPKWDFSPKGKVYKEIKYFMELLLEKQFK